MLIRTHLLITLFFVLLLFNSVNAKYKILFVIVALLATYIPDLDSQSSKIGNRKILRILQFFTKHRGMIHSFTFLILITLVFVLFLPVVSLGFFLGYGLHLLADSFTMAGITPFYPYKKKTCGRVRTGGKSETIVFVVLLFADLGLLIWKISLSF